MTLVDFDWQERANGPNDQVLGVMHFAPNRGQVEDEHYVLPAMFSVRYSNAPVQVSLVELPIGMAWMLNAEFGDQRVAGCFRNTGAGPIPYVEIPQLDPLTLDPVPPPGDTWTVEAENLQAQIDALVVDPSGFYYAHDQALPASEWTVPHNLGLRPNVSVLIGDELVEADTTHLDLNTVRVAFPSPQTGKVVCS